MTDVRHAIARLLGAAHPACFTDEVMEHQFPAGFKPTNIDQYDRTTNPKVWIKDFLFAVHIEGGDNIHAIKYLPLKIKGSARHWLNSLPPDSIAIWDDVEDEFMANFQGTYVQPLDSDGLAHIIQKNGESVRKFWNHFLTKKNQISRLLRRRSHRGILKQCQRRMASQRTRAHQT